MYYFPPLFLPLMFSNTQSLLKISNCFLTSLTRFPSQSMCFLSLLLYVFPLCIHTAAAPLPRSILKHFFFINISPKFDFAFISLNLFFSQSEHFLLHFKSFLPQRFLCFLSICMCHLFLSSSSALCFNKSILSPFYFLFNKSSILFPRKKMGPKT